MVVSKENQKLLIRIVQVDKDGGMKESRAFRAIYY